MSTGFFETLRTYDGEPALLHAHLARLSAAGVVLDNAALTAEIGRLLSACDDDVVIRITAEGGPPQVELRKLPAHATEDPELPLTAILADVPGYAYPLKSTERGLHTDLINLAADTDAFEALIVDDGRVIEGTRTNVFALFGDQLVTPPLGRPLPGVTRSAVIEIAPSLGFAIEERVLDTDELTAADEVLLTNALMGVRRVSQIDGVPVGGRNPAARRQLHEALLARYEVDR